MNCQEAVEKAKGKPIASVVLTENELVFGFADGSGLRFEDMGQSCCEHRYMSSDDDVKSYVGNVFLGAELGEEREAGVDQMEDTQFLDIKTDRGVFTIVNHNDHNGYYGGFDVNAVYWDP